MSAYDDAVARLDQTPATPYYNLKAKTAGNPGGLAADGHRTSFFGILADILTVAAEAIAKAALAVTSASNAAASAATALSAPGTNATSTTNTVAIGTGAKTLTIQTGKSLIGGMYVLAADAANPANYILGPISTYNSATGSLTLNVLSAGGSGTPANWNVSITAAGALYPTRQVLTGGLATGGGDLTADRTITVPSAAAAAVRTGTTTAQAMTPGDTYGGLAVVTLTDAATIACDMAAFINATITLGGNRTLGAPTNAKPGQCGFIELVQDGTGSRTLAFASTWKREGGPATVSTAAGAKDYLFYEVVTASLVIYSFVKAPS